MDKKLPALPEQILECYVESTEDCCCILPQRMRMCTGLHGASPKSAFTVTGARMSNPTNCCVVSWIPDLTELALPFLRLSLPAEWSPYVTQGMCHSIVHEPCHEIKMFLARSRCYFHCGLL
jgi:hypothetical protein